MRGGIDDIERDQMRHVAGDPQHQVMMLGIHDLDVRAELLPEGPQPRHLRRIRPRQRRQNAPAVVVEFGKARMRPGMLGAGNRMPRDEMHA